MSSKLNEKKDTDKYAKRSTIIQNKYPGFVPIIANGMNGLVLSKNKFLVHKDAPVTRLLVAIRSKTNLTPEEALYLSCCNHIPKQSDLMSVLYSKYSDKDGFMYIKVYREETFG